MKKIVLFDPSYGTLNLGDQIINEAIMDEMSAVFDSGYLARFGTHTPVLHEYQMLLSNGIKTFCEQADWKFLGGTNLIKTTLISKKPGWNINPLTASLYENSIAIGVGTGGTGSIKNGYTKRIYRRALSKDYVHSARDRRTVEILQSVGLRAVNTGCPTMWSLTPEHCAKIPVSPSRDVVYTVTDYAKNPSADLATLEVLARRYENIYVWIQGARDYQYLIELGFIDRVKVISPNLAAYKKFLVDHDTDYVGTRLHAGIYAMKHQRRAIIVAVDHRALDIQATHNINVVRRGDVEALEELIPNDLVTDVRLDLRAASSWMAQFHAPEASATEVQ